MIAADHPIRVTARLKLSAGVKPETVVDNLIRTGYLRDEATEAVALELAAKKLPNAKPFVPIETRKSLLDRYADSSKPLLLGLAITAIGTGLFLYFLFALGFAVRLFLIIAVVGFVIALYGIMTLGDE